MLIYLLIRFQDLSLGIEEVLVLLKANTKKKDSILPITMLSENKQEVNLLVSNLRYQPVLQGQQNGQQKEEASSWEAVLLAEGRRECLMSTTQTFAE